MSYFDDQMEAWEEMLDSGELPEGTMPSDVDPYEYWASKDNELCDVE